MIINIDKKPIYHTLSYFKKIMSFIIILFKRRNFEKKIFHDGVKLKQIFKMGYPGLVRDNIGNTICTSCRLCEDICPTKAIEISKANMINFPSSLVTGEAPLKFILKVDDCTKCGLCEAACYINALSIGNEYNQPKVDLVAFESE